MPEKSSKKRAEKERVRARPIKQWSPGTEIKLCSIPSRGKTGNKKLVEKKTFSSRFLYGKPAVIKITRRQKIVNPLSKHKPEPFQTPPSSPSPKNQDDKLISISLFSKLFSKRWVGSFPLLPSIPGRSSHYIIRCHWRNSLNSPPPSSPIQKGWAIPPIQIDFGEVFKMGGRRGSHLGTRKSMLESSKIILKWIILRIIEWKRDLFGSPLLHLLIGANWEPIREGEELSTRGFSFSSSFSLLRSSKTPLPFSPLMGKGGSLDHLNLPFPSLSWV